MRRALILSIPMALLSCTQDVISNDYSMKYHTHKMRGDYITAYVADSDTFFSRFIPNYFDSIGNRRFNLLQMEITPVNQTYELREMIKDGQSSFEFSVKNIYEMPDGSINYGEVRTYEVDMMSIQNDTVIFASVWSADGNNTTFDLIR